MPRTERDPTIGQLVLSRKPNETIVVQSPEGTLITVSVIEIRGDKVLLMTRAPKSWRVHRGEIFDKIESEPQGAQS